MNITNTKHNLLRIWLEGFLLVNRCTGKLLWVVIISIVLFVLVSALLALTIGTSGMLAMLQGGRAAQAVGIGAVLAYFAFTLGANIYGVIFCTVCWRLMAKEALGEKQPLAETFSSSVVPALYQIAAGFLIAIPMILLGMISAILARVSPVLVALLMIVLFFTVGIRLCYSFIAIAVADKGPIEGLLHSWKMTAGKNYTDALLMCLLLVGYVLLMYLFFAAIGYGFFVMIPLHFANSFSLAHPSLIWILVAFVLGIIALFWYFVLLAFPLLVFLNRNAVLFDARNTEKDTTIVPLPGLHLPDIRPNPEHMQQNESTLHARPLPTQEIQALQQPQSKEERSQTALDEKAPVQENASLEGFEVSQSSINTSEEDTNTLSEHLDKVYKPKPEDIVQYVDEDRMPTILFDDEMAKQLQANQDQYGTKPHNENTDKKDNGPDTIKMSKF